MLQFCSFAFAFIVERLKRLILLDYEMKLLSWDYRGAGRKEFVSELHLILKQNSPDIMFICETKCSSTSFKHPNWECRLDVASEGRSGGLCLLWNGFFGINVVLKSRYMMVVQPLIKRRQNV